MNTNTTFLPLAKMIERNVIAREESDTTYFYDLLVLGEFLSKTIIASIVSGLTEEKDRNKYRLLHRLVRADGIGEWSAVLEEALNGVPSQYLQKTITQNEQKELNTKLKSDSWQHEAVKELVDVFPLVNLEKVTVPERIQGKQWFSYFAQLRNGTRAHGALNPLECSQACRGLEKSLKKIIENIYLFKREWAFLHQNLNGRYRVTSLNGSSKEFDSLRTAKSNSNYPNGIFVYFDSITKVDILYSDADASDFFLPNGNFKEKTYETLSYYSNTRQFITNEAYLTPVNELPESETQGLGNLIRLGNCLGNIPPISKDYINRKDLEAELTQILQQEDRYPIVTLRGRGGIGKTTLAISVVHEIAKSKRFDLVLWFSSRDIDLKIEGPKPVKNSILTETDIADEFCKLIGGNSFEKAAVKLNNLANELTKSEYGKILFVFDNFETVQNPTELFNWLDTYVRNPNKILITSRINKSFKADYPIEIQGMDDGESRELIKQVSKQLNIQELISDKLTESIIEEAEGHPYVMKILIGQIARNPKTQQIERIMATQDDILTALFKRTYNTLTPASKRIFLTLCSWRSAIPLIAIEAVMLRAEIQEKIDIDNCIDELQKSSFIDIISSESDLTAFVSVPLAAFIFGKGELEVSPMKIAIQTDRELLLEFGVTQQAEIQNGILPRIERKFRAVAKRITSTNETIQDHLPVLEFLCRKFPYAWNFLYQLYMENDDLEKAEESLREYLKTDLDLIEKKKTLEKISTINIHKQNWFGQVNTLTELCLLPNATIEQISDTANIINNYVFKDESHTAKIEVDNEIKESLIRKVAEVMRRKINNSKNVTATDYSRLAWLYMHLQDYETARESVEKGLAIDFSNIYCIRLATKLGILN